MRVGKPARWFLMLLAFWLVATTSLVTVAVWKSPDVRAIIGMGWGRIILWIGVSGSLTYLFRERIRQLTVRIPLGWRFWSR